MLPREREEATTLCGFDYFHFLLQKTIIDRLSGAEVSDGILFSFLMIFVN